MFRLVFFFWVFSLLWLFQWSFNSIWLICGNVFKLLRYSFRDLFFCTIWFSFFGSVIMLWWFNKFFKPESSLSFLFSVIICDFRLKFIKGWVVPESIIFFHCCLWLDLEIEGFLIYSLFLFWYLAVQDSKNCLCWWNSVYQHIRFLCYYIRYTLFTQQTSWTRWSSSLLFLILFSFGLDS